MRRRLLITIASLFVLLLLLIRASGGAMDNPFSGAQHLGKWVAAAFTLFALSFLYGDNPFYRFTEHVFVGVTAAYWMVMGFWSTLVPKLMANIVPEIPVLVFGMDYPLNVPLARRLFYCLPLVLGLLLLARLWPRTRWVGAGSLAFIVGTTAGLRLMASLEAGFLQQIGNSIVPLVSLSEKGLAIGPTLNGLILVGGLICCLCYFTFDRRAQGLLRLPSQAGLWILMVTFGAGFGFTVMGRVALLVGRIEFLLHDWLGLI
jgi:hypothetical protein